MNREIKFRAWYENKMHKVVALWEDGDARIPYNSGLENGDKFRDAINPEIMQYTGLKDKNGKEIYEGDIIKYLFEGTKNCSIVRFENGLLMPFYETFAGQGHFYNYMEEIEIIGNIYEHPELLTTK